MRRKVGRLLLALLAFGGGWGWSQEAEVPPSDSTPSAPSQGAPPKAEAKAEVVDPAKASAFLLASRREVALYLDRFAYGPLAQALHELVVKRGIRVRLLVPAEAFSARDSYAMSFAFLALRRPNLEVKVLGGGKVDPRAIVDGSYLLVGYPLEGLPPEVRGPLLLFRDSATVRPEADRFDRYWASAPYCRPRARYEGGGLRTWCELSQTRP